MRKRKKKIAVFRLLAALAVLLAGLATAAYITLNRIFKPEDMRAIITHQLEEVFKRPVSAGAARFSFTGKISVKNLKIASLNDSVPYFLKADEIKANYDFVKMLFRRISINSLYFKSPEINFVRGEDGNWNFENIFRGEKSKKITDIKNAEILNARVKVKDLTKKKNYVFSDINFKVFDFKLDEESSFTLSMVFDTAGIKGRGYAEGLFNLGGLDLEKAYVKNADISATLADKQMNALINVENFDKPLVNARLRISPIRLKNPGGTRGTYLDLPKLTADLSFRAAGPGKFEILSASVKNDGLKIELSGNVSAPGRPVEYDLTCFSNSFPLKKIIEIFPESPMTLLSGQGQFKLSVSKSGVSYAFANVENASLKYKNIDAFKFGGTLLLRENMEKSKISAKAKRIKIGETVVSDLSFSAKIKEKILSCDLSAEWQQKPLRISLRVSDPLSGSKRMSVTANFENVDLNKFKNAADSLKNLFGPGKKEGKKGILPAGWMASVRNSLAAGYDSVNFNVKTKNAAHSYFRSRNLYVSARLKNLSGDLAKIKGEISLKSERGVFFDVQENAEKNKIYHVIAMPVLLMFKMNRFSALKIGATLKDIYFNSIGAEYSLNEGNINIHNFYIDGKQFSAHSFGNINLLNETIDLKIYTIFHKYYSMGGLPQYLTDKSGKPALAFRLKGKMTEPDIKLLDPSQVEEKIRKAGKRGLNINYEAINSLPGFH